MPNYRDRSFDFRRCRSRKWSRPVVRGDCGLYDYHTFQSEDMWTNGSNDSTALPHPMHQWLTAGRIKWLNESLHPMDQFNGSHSLHHCIPLQWSTLILKLNSLMDSTLTPGWWIGVLRHYALRNKKTVKSENPIPRHGDFHQKKAPEKDFMRRLWSIISLPELIKRTTLIKNGILIYNPNSENEKSIL